jgi:protein gp37
VKSRVFCASMGDVFEDHPQTGDARARLFTLIERTLWLDWMLLTKRPENIMDMIPIDWVPGLPDNVWIGTSVEDQQRADERIPALLDVPAQVRFLSCEPLIGPVDLQYVLGVERMDVLESEPNPWGVEMFATMQGRLGGGLHWVIVGGESGPGARPMHPHWARTLRDQCETAEVAFFMKQWGAWAPSHDRHADLMMYAEPDAEDTAVALSRVGKKHAGRLLDGRTWDDVPDGVPVLL